MTSMTTDLFPGIYRYTYPTFEDSPQYICVHFLTSDGQQAFVSYPHHPRCKAAQLVRISWFEAVELVWIDGRPQLMAFIQHLVSAIVDGNSFDRSVPKIWVDESDTSRFGEQLAA